jgi:hypothetical protein
MFRVVIRRRIFVLSTGCIRMYFSEYLFRARFRPGEDTLGGYGMTWLQIGF